MRNIDAQNYLEMIQELNQTLDGVMNMTPDEPFTAERQFCEEVRASIAHAINRLAQARAENMIALDRRVEVALERVANGMSTQDDAALLRRVM